MNYYQMLIMGSSYASKKNTPYKYFIANELLLNINYILCLVF